MRGRTKIRDLIHSLAILSTQWESADRLAEFLPTQFLSFTVIKGTLPCGSAEVCMPVTTCEKGPKYSMGLNLNSTSIHKRMCCFRYIYMWEISTCLPLYQNSWCLLEPVKSLGQNLSLSELLFSVNKGKEKKHRLICQGFLTLTLMAILGHV